MNKLSYSPAPSCWGWPAVPDIASRRSRSRFQRRQVTILYVADLHAQLRAHPELFWRDGEERVEQAGGFARVAAAIEQIKQERGGDVLVLDAGDTIQGSGAAALTRGRGAPRAAQRAGAHGGVPGNWEVVYGPAVLRERAPAS